MNLWVEMANGNNGNGGSIHLGGSSKVRDVDVKDLPGPFQPFQVLNLLD